MGFLTWVPWISKGSVGRIQEVVNWEREKITSLFSVTLIFSISFNYGYRPGTTVVFIVPVTLLPIGVVDFFFLNKFIYLFIFG